MFFDRLGKEKFCHYETWYVDRRFVVSILSLILILPLCYSRKIDFLKYASGAATAGVFYLVLVTIIVYYRTDTSSVIVKSKYEIDSQTLYFQC